MLLLQRPSLCSIYNDIVVYSLNWTEARSDGDQNSIISSAHLKEFSATPASVTIVDSRVSLLINSSQIRENAVINYTIQIFGNIVLSKGNTLCKQHGNCCIKIL